MSASRNPKPIDDPRPPESGATVGLVRATAADREEQLLRDARLRGLERNINEIEMVLRPDGSVVEANDRALSAYGYERSEILALNIRDLRAPHTLAALPAQLEDALHPDGARYESDHRRRDGSTFPVEVSSRAFTVGTETFLHNLVRDVSAERRADAERRLLADLVRAMNDAVIATDLELRITTWTGAAARIYGWTAEEAVGRSVEDLLDPISPESDPSDQARRIRTGEPVRSYLRPRHKSGARLEMDVSMMPVREGTRVTGFLSVHRDIAAQKAAERALNASHEQLALVMTATRDGFWDRDLESGKLLLSNRVARMLGVPADELGASWEAWRARLHQDDVAALEDAVSAHLDEHADRIDVEVRARTGDDAFLWLRVRGRVVDWDPSGKPTRLAGTLTEVTARKRAQLALEADLAENQRLVGELREALQHARGPGGLAALCTCCKKVCGEGGYWEPIEAYLAARAGVALSSTTCPACSARELGDEPGTTGRTRPT